jgi:hypothetical protein
MSRSHNSLNFCCFASMSNKRNTPFFGSKRNAKRAHFPPFQTKTKTNSVLYPQHLREGRYAEGRGSTENMCDGHRWPCLRGGACEETPRNKRSLECNVNGPRFMQQYCIYGKKKKTTAGTASLISTISKEGSVAEWSKALVLGTSPQGRGFESHRCQIFSSRRD